MNAQRPCVAEVIAEGVARAGAKYVFGHPGGEVVVLIDALQRAGVRFVLTHHEYTAAIMAAAAGEFTGSPGVCIATLGPGATNVLGGVAAAFLERAPLLALTGSSAPGSAPGISHQCLDLTELFSPVTKLSRTISASGAPSAIHSALALTTVPRQGPVHLAVPAAIASLASVEGPSPANGPPTAPLVAPQALVGPRELAKAFRLISSAQRPAIIAGLGAVRGMAHKELRRLAELLGAPVALLPKAKGVVPAGHPWFAGVLEMAGDDLVIEFLKGADLILNVGVDAVEFAKPWRLDVPVIHIDAVGNDSHYFPSEVELVGPISGILKVLATEVTSTRAWDGEVAAHMLALRDHIKGATKRFTPFAVVDALAGVLRDETIATCDVGAHKLLVGQAWPVDGPRAFFMANGLSSMGYALPAAMSIKLLSRDTRVIAFLGDGGLAMYLGELETCARLGSKILIVVFADSSLELIRRSQLTRNLEPTGTSFTNPDFRQLGESFGIPVHLVSSVEELHRAVNKTEASEGPQMVVAQIDGDDYIF